MTSTCGVRALLLLCAVAAGLLLPAHSAQPTMPELRKLEQFAYGHLTVAGASVPFEAFRATFGGALPCGTTKIVLGTPIDGCGEVTNDVEGKFVLFVRGTCSFVDKARRAFTAGAAGVVIANNVGGLLRMPMGGQAGDDISIPVVMVTNATGSVLTNALADDSIRDVGIDASILPKSEPCLPPHAMEEWFAAKGPLTEAEMGALDVQHQALGTPQGVQPTYGGVIGIAHSNRQDWFEFATAEFGGVVVPRNDLELSQARPVDACEELSMDFDGRVAVAHRGVCPMITKARNVQAAGASMLLIINDRGVGAVAAMPDDFPGNVHIPVIMISQASGRMLVAASDEKFAIDITAVEANAWNTLDSLQELDRDDWPADSAERAEWFRELIRAHHPESPQGSWERWRFLRKVVRASGFIPEMKNILTQFTDSELATGSLPDDNTAARVTNFMLAPRLLRSRPVAALSDSTEFLVPHSTMPCAKVGHRWYFNDPAFTRSSTGTAVQHLRVTLQAIECLEKVLLQYAVSAGHATTYLKGQLTRQQSQETIAEALRSLHPDADASAIDLYEALAELDAARDTVDATTPVGNWLDTLAAANASDGDGPEGEEAGGSDTPAAAEEGEVSSDGEWSV